MADSALVDSVHNGYHVPAVFSPVVAVYLRVTMASGVPTVVAAGSSSGSSMTGSGGAYVWTFNSKAARLLMFVWTSIQTEAAFADFQIEVDASTTGSITLESAAAAGGAVASPPDGDYLFKLELAMRSP